MKKTALLIFTILSLLSAMNAQTRDEKALSTSGQSKAQTAELKEASALSESVIKLYNEGKYDEALPLAKRALEIGKNVSGPNSDSVGAASLNLAYIYMAKEKYGDAESFFNDALAIFEKSLGPDNLKISSILNRLALLQYFKGNTHKAENLYERSLAIKEKILGAENPVTIDAISELAEFYQYNGEYSKADPMYQRLVALKEKIAEQEHPEEFADALQRYACLMRKTKRGDEATQLEDKAYRITHSGESFKPSDTPEKGVLNGKAIILARPRYPVAAMGRRLSSIVKVRVTIDESGNVIRACAVEGMNVFMKDSEWAAYHSKFTPTLLANKPVKVTGFISYNFVAQ